MNVCQRIKGFESLSTDFDIELHVPSRPVAPWFPLCRLRFPALEAGALGNLTNLLRRSGSLGLLGCKTGHIEVRARVKNAYSL